MKLSNILYTVSLHCGGGGAIRAALVHSCSYADKEASAVYVAPVPGPYQGGAAAGTAARSQGPGRETRLTPADRSRGPPAILW